jgi:hypothetical protein
MKFVVSSLRAFCSERRIVRFVVYSVLTAAVIVTAIPHYSKEVEPHLISTHVLQADAFIHGRLAVGDADELQGFELSVFEGKKYVCLPPFPAILLMPFVAIWGMQTHVSVIGLSLALFSVIILKRILQRLQIDEQKIPWLVSAFVLGTAYWWCVSRSSAPWLISQVVAVTCLLLAIHEAVGKGRGHLVGMFLGMAILSRQLSVYSAIFLLAVLWNGGVEGAIPGRRQRLTNLILFCVGAGIWVGLYLALNWARFGNPFDTGYAYIPLGGFLRERVDQHGIFSIAYVPFNFTYMFLQGFRIPFGGEDMLAMKRFDGFGAAVTFASPFIFYDFRARWRGMLRIGAWGAVTLCLLHMLLYYNNGWFQGNCQRFTMDFMPVLILLVALGINRSESSLWKYAISYSIGLNFLAYIVLPGIRYLRAFLSME